MFSENGEALGLRAPCAELVNSSPTSAPRKWSWRRSSRVTGRSRPNSPPLPSCRDSVARCSCCVTVQLASWRQLLPEWQNEGSSLADYATTHANRRELHDSSALICSAPFSMPLFSGSPRFCTQGSFLLPGKRNPMLSLRTLSRCHHYAQLVESGGRKNLWRSLSQSQLWRGRTEGRGSRFILVMSPVLSLEHFQITGTSKWPRGLVKTATKARDSGLLDLCWWHQQLCCARCVRHLFQD